MFHAIGNLFFGRRVNGDVRIIRMPKDWAPQKEAAWTAGPKGWPSADSPFPFPGCESDTTLGPDAWSSVVASVSAHGETGPSFRAFRRFHDGCKPKGESGKCPVCSYEPSLAP